MDFPPGFMEGSADSKAYKGLRFCFSLFHGPNADQWKLLSHIISSKRITFWILTADTCENTVPPASDRIHVLDRESRINSAQLQSRRQHPWGAEVEQSCLWARGAWCAPCGLSACTPEPLTAPSWGLSEPLMVALRLLLYISLQSSFLWR